ncbi:hypothetical protein SOVF_145560 [Spinacia oleracea]|nr:hypothetical protein SOVF_145560 [Spinacia oleracea]
MKVVQTKYSLAILITFSILVVALGSASDRKQEVRRCEEQCQRQQPYFEEHLCRQRCQVHFQEVERRNVRDDDAEEEYELCQQTCPGSGKRQWECQRRCQDDYEAALKRERERGHEHDHEHEHEDEDEDEHDRERDPDHEHHHGGGGDRHPREHDYTHCLHRCEDEEEGFPRQRQCKLDCEDQFGRHREGHKHHRRGEQGRRKGFNILNKIKLGKEAVNPYYFNSKSFESRYSTREGHMKVLQRFSEKSNLLLGIDRFRIGIYEANPNTFMLPHHWDADSVLFFIKGKAIVTFLKQENRKTFNVERGDVLMIPSGTTAYLTNIQNDEKLQIAELLRPVNIPGRYQIPREQLEKLLNQQKEGAIVKASEEQVRALGHGMSRRQFGESKGKFSLLDGRPQMSNEHGEFYEVTPNDYELLEDLDVSVAYCDIKQGSMMAPNYNSRTTFIVLVEEGSGYFEIARPLTENTSNKKEQGSSQMYEKVSSRLTKGDVFIVPAGHPLALVASENESLKTIGFGINAKNNQRNFLAGQENIINQLDEQAMELSFNLPARDVQEMFQRQRQSYFMAGPKQQQNPIVSLLDFAGF